MASRSWRSTETFAQTARSSNNSFLLNSSKQAHITRRQALKRAPGRGFSGLG